MFFFYIGNAQQTNTSKYGVEIIDKLTEYQKTVGQDSLKQLVSLKQAVPAIVYDLRYASRDNFMKRPMYPKNTHHTLMRKEPAHALTQVQDELQQKGLGLKIFDAYRPYAVTVRFWELVHDERYVANPSKGSGHNRGLAVDLTLIDLKTGKELDMGTGFDNFTDTAHHNFTQLPQAVLDNRRLLKTTMENHGFVLYESEWWHYFWPNNRSYEVLDLPFSKLLKAN